MLLFLFANSGIAVNLHYCRGKFSSIQFFANGTGACKCGKKTMKAGCCKNVTTIIKAVDDLDKANSITVPLQIENLNFTLPLLKVKLDYPPIQLQFANFYHPPPPKKSCPIFLLDGVFRI